MSKSTGTCSKCHGVLDGAHHSYCKACMAARARGARTKDPELYRERNRQWIRDNPEKFKRIKRNSDLKREFGITLDEYEQMLEAQDFKCAICHGPLIPWPHLDHDHTTGKVREILCHQDNLAIGNCKDDPARARAVADYLDKHSTKEG